MTLVMDDPQLRPSFWARVSPEPMSGCWLWTGNVAPSGYGLPAQHLAHRLALKVDTGADPRPSDFACHHCDTPLCVNPGHLYWGTAKTNAADHNGRHGHPNSHKIRCPAGHDLIEDNLVPWKLARGVRECRTCSNAQKTAWKARSR